jgi:hypothetical protein
MKNIRYELLKVEATDSDIKKLELVWKGLEWVQALEKLESLISYYWDSRVSLQLQEVETSGTRLVRIHIEIDGRPTCKTRDQWGPDKYGFKQ